MNIKKLAVAAVAVSLFAGAAWAEVPPNCPPHTLSAKGCLHPGPDLTAHVPPPPMQQAGETVFQQGHSVTSEYMFSARMTSGNGNFNDTLVIQNTWTASSGIVGFQETVSVSASNDTITLVYVTLLGGHTVVTPATATTKFVGSFSPKPTIKVTLESGFPTNCPPPQSGGLAKANCGPGSYGRGGTLYYGGITVNGIETVTRTINMAALPLNVAREWFCGVTLLCDAIGCDQTRLLKGTLTVGNGRTLTVGRSEDYWACTIDPLQPPHSQATCPPWKVSMADYHDLCGINPPCVTTAPWHSYLTGTGIVVNPPPPETVCPDWMPPPGSEYFKIVIGDGVTHIGNFAFAMINSDCSMGPMSVSIGKDVVSIGDGAFSNSLGNSYDLPVSVTIPDNVKRIGQEAFAASAISSVTIGAGVDSIFGGAFSYCQNLKTVVSKRPAPPVLFENYGKSGSGQDIILRVFADIAEGACLYVPDESVAAYQGWGGFECVKPLGETSISHRSRSVKNSASAAVSVSVRGRTLNVSSPNNSALSIRMIDMRGKTVARYNVGATVPGRPHSFALTKIPAGRYFVEVRYGVRRDRASIVIK